MRTGDYFGELGVLAGEPSSLHVVARKDLHVMKLPPQPSWNSLDGIRRHVHAAEDIGARLAYTRAG